MGSEQHLGSWSRAAFPQGQVELTCRVERQQW